MIELRSSASASASGQPGPNPDQKKRNAVMRKENRLHEEGQEALRFFGNMLLMTGHGGIRQLSMQEAGVISGSGH